MRAELSYYKRTTNYKLKKVGDVIHTSFYKFLMERECVNVSFFRYARIICQLTSPPVVNIVNESTLHSLSGALRWYFVIGAFRLAFCQRYTFPSLTITIAFVCVYRFQIPTSHTRIPDHFVMYSLLYKQKNIFQNTNISSECHGPQSS